MTAKQADLAARYGIVGFPPDQVFPPGELFPGKPVYVVREEDGARKLDVISRGFRHRVRGASGKMLDKPVTNVRNLTSPLWRSTLANPAKRCTLPVYKFL